MTSGSEPLTLDPASWTPSDDGSYCSASAYFCENVVSEQYQYMNIYVPAAYLNDDGTVNDNGTVNGYTAATAPIVFQNECAGWNSSTPGRVNTAYMAEGFVYVSCGARSRNATVTNADGDFDYSVGKAPAPVVDLKAGVRFLHLNADAIPGDEEKIVSVGTSGAGQMSSALGASGNMEAYYPYLYEIGAAGVQYENGEYTSTIRDDIYACMCYCPIADINNADLAYAWTRFDSDPGKYSFTDFQTALQDLEAEYFVDYVNQLGIQDLDGNVLTLDGTREGSYYDQILQNISDALNAYLAAAEWPFTPIASGRSASSEEPQTYEPEKDYLARYGDTSGWLMQNDDGTYSVTDLAGFLEGTGLQRNKDVPGFDTLGMTMESNAFGPDDVYAVHFSDGVGTVIAENYDTLAALDGFDKDSADGYVAVPDDADVMAQTSLMNATRILLDVAVGARDADIAQHWRTRNGTADEHTSFTIAYNLAMAANMAGAESVDYSLVWAMPHGSNEGTTTGTLIDWIKDIC